MTESFSFSINQILIWLNMINIKNRRKKKNHIRKYETNVNKKAITIKIV